MNDGNIRFAELDDAWRLADMHARRINEGFLASLGPVFLGRLYRRVVRSPRAFAIVAEENGRVVAFCAAAENVGRLYREFMVRDGIQAGVASAPRLVRSLPHVVETLRYPAATGELPDAEILAVVTDTDGREQGLGFAGPARDARRARAPQLFVGEGRGRRIQRGRAAAVRAVRIRAAPTDLDSRRRALGSVGMGVVVAFVAAFVVALVATPVARRRCRSRSASSTGPVR